MQHIDYVTEMGLTPQTLNRMMNENPSLRGFVSGYRNEDVLTAVLSKMPGIEVLDKQDDHVRKSRKADRRIRYQGQEFLIESKSIQTNLTGLRDGKPSTIVQVDGSDSRLKTLQDGTKMKTVLLEYGGFDILAVCMHDLTKQWHFAFCLNEDLPASQTNHQLIKSSVMVSDPLAQPFTYNIYELLDRLLLKR